MLLEGEREEKRWKSIIATNFRIIQRRGIFWTSYRDINYDHLSSIFTGRRPIWWFISIGVLLFFLSKFVPEMVWFFLRLFFPNPQFILLSIGVVLIVVGCIGETKTVFYGTNAKVEERGKSLEFMRLVNELRLKYIKERLIGKNRLALEY